MSEQNEIKTVLVCFTQAVFDKLEPAVEEPEEEDESLGQARQVAKMAADLVLALKAANLMAETVSVPQRSFAPRDVAKAAFGWRLLDLSQSNGVKVDLLVCLDFPAWSVSHPYKVCWLLTMPHFVSRRHSGPRPSLTIPLPSSATAGRVLQPIIGPSNGPEDTSQTVASLLQAERRGLSEAKRVLAGNREIAQELARSGLHTEFNPLPLDLATDPAGPAWQEVIKRLITIPNAR